MARGDGLGCASSMYANGGCSFTAIWQAELCGLMTSIIPSYPLRYDMKHGVFLRFPAHLLLSS